MEDKPLANDDWVEVIYGLWSAFSGRIEEIRGDDADVAINIFGRTTRLTLRLNQLRRDEFEPPQR